MDHVVLEDGVVVYNTGEVLGRCEAARKKWLWGEASFSGRAGCCLVVTDGTGNSQSVVTPAQRRRGERTTPTVYSDSLS
jgi:hypothetical protein